MFFNSIDKRYTLIMMDPDVPVTCLNPIIHMVGFDIPVTPPSSPAPGTLQYATLNLDAGKIVESYKFV